MALSEFLRNLRIGARLQTPTVQSDDSGDNNDTAARQLARAALWLTPRVVDGFDATDFPNLTPRQRGDLVESVNRFRAIASQTPGNAPASNEQFHEGLQAFNRVLDILRPYVADPEGERVLQILMGMSLPNFILGIYCETEEDSSGDVALDIWLIVTDTAVEMPDFWSQIDIVRDAIDRTLRAERIQPWWHVHIRTASEHLESLVAYES